jgi:hypothetical protein
MEKTRYVFIGEGQQIVRWRKQEKNLHVYICITFDKSGKQNAEMCLKPNFLR